MKPQKPKVEVKELAVTDTCNHCGCSQGGYVNVDLDRYLNVREGHICANCGVPEKVL